MANLLLILVCFMLIIQDQQTVFGGPVSGAACCTVCCGLGSAPFGPWAVGFCIAGCIGSVGITPFFVQCVQLHLLHRLHKSKKNWRKRSIVNHDDYISKFFYTFFLGNK